MTVINVFILVVLTICFGAAFLAIWSLVQTILPRIKRGSDTAGIDLNRMDPTFFGGIRELSGSDDYFVLLKQLEEDEEHILQLLSRQVHALGTINWAKNAHLRRGVGFFIVAIGTELLMILSTFIKTGLDSLSL